MSPEFEFFKNCSNIVGYWKELCLWYFATPYCTIVSISVKNTKIDYSEKIEFNDFIIIF